MFIITDACVLLFILTLRIPFGNYISRLHIFIFNSFHIIKFIVTQLQLTMTATINVSKY